MMGTTGQSTQSQLDALLVLATNPDKVAEQVKVLKASAAEHEKVYQKAITAQREIDTKKAELLKIETELAPMRKQLDADAETNRANLQRIEQERAANTQEFTRQRNDLNAKEEKLKQAINDHNSNVARHATNVLNLTRDQDAMGRKAEEVNRKLADADRKNAEAEKLRATFQQKLEHMNKLAGG